MAKELLFDLEAKKKLLNGIKKVSRAVSSTLGPKGNNVAIERKWGSPSVIHDGVSVAKEIDLVDSFENMGAQLIKEAAQKTNDKAGDGTTTATILTDAIASESLKAINSGSNPMMLRKGIEAATEKVIKILDKRSKKITSPAEIKNIATISAQNNEIGDIISKAFEKLGNEAIIAVEESRSAKISIEFKEGYSFDKGYVAPHFVNSEKTQEAVIENPYILVTDKKINSPVEFNPFLEKFFKTPKNGGLVIIANEISGNPLATLILNKVNNNLPIVAVEAPVYGGNREEALHDIAVVTGGTFVAQASEQSLADLDDSAFGRAEKVIVSKNSTIISGGFGDKEKIKERAVFLEELAEKTDNEFEAEKAIERKAKLTSGMAVIEVGAYSEMEMKEKRERCIDAVSATKAAIDEGVVPGGETALLSASMELDIPENEDQDIKNGWHIVIEACKSPFKKLMENSNYNEGQMLERLLNSKVENAGVNVITGEIENMIKAGIIDPVKVTKSALQHSVSTATMIMTTNTLIVESKENKEENATR
ncbi:MAG: molecular chaperone GroEL [Candidatus Omnitrophica bacterium]|nr:molecular chaperone GroEL [Candidatus Omnitrophota bacterium]